MAPTQSRHYVVIGAGVLGASVAARLAGSGVRVTLLEQDQPGRATSRWSFAWLNSNDKSPRHYHDLNHAGIWAWAALAPDLDGASWYRPVGHIELATSPAARAELTARVRRLASWNYDARLVDAAEVAELEPSLRLPKPATETATETATEPGTIAAWFPGEGYLLTEPLIARLVAHASNRGAEIRTGEQGRVVALDPGRPSHVRTAAGALIAADEVICCAGRWVPELTTMANPAPLTTMANPAPSGPANTIPLIPWDTPGATAPGLVVQVGPVGPAGPTRLVHTAELALRPHPGGLLHLEAPDAAVDLHTLDADLRRWAGELLRRAQQTVRGLDQARVVEYQVCVRPMPVDGQSIVGPVPGIRGYYVAVTHSGVTLAAHLSELIAAELTAGTASTQLAELAPYRPSRFSTSSATPGATPD